MQVSGENFVDDAARRGIDAADSSAPARHLIVEDDAIAENAQPVEPLEFPILVAERRYATVFSWRVIATRSVSACLIKAGNFACASVTEYVECVGETCKLFYCD